jgi:hypothetical protein
MWDWSSTMISSPGRVWTRIATRLHIVPEGMNTPASCPSRSATRAQSARVVGSESDCSSPTSARAMASRIPGVGRVWVSLNRSIIVRAQLYTKYRRHLSSERPVRQPIRLESIPYPRTMKHDRHG